MATNNAINNTLSSPVISTGIFDQNGNQIIALNAVSSAINYINTSNATTTNNPSLAAVGGDTNIGLLINGKGNSGGLVQGATSGSTAPSGYKGEVISSSVLNSSAISVTNQTTTQVTSISLTAGNWMVIGNVSFRGSTTNLGWALAAINNAVVLPDPSLLGGPEFVSAVTGFFGVNAPSTILTLTGTTTIYLICFASILSGTVTACGNIYAIRI